MLTQNFPLNQDQIERYSRQILLKEIGGTGMRKLLDSTVGVIGAGGLGCPAIQVLAGAGVGHIKVIDGDRVEISNLPRQYLHFTSDIGEFKVDSVKKKVEAMNPDVKLETFRSFLTKENIKDFLTGCTAIIEASDRIGTKFLVNDACVHFHIPFVVAGVVQYYGQFLVVIPGETACYRCVFNEPIPEKLVPSCSGAGVLGSAPALGGVLQANEIIKTILGIKSGFPGHLFSFDLLKGAFDFITLNRNTGCKACANPDDPFYLSADYSPMNDRCESTPDSEELPNEMKYDYFSEYK